MKIHLCLLSALVGLCWVLAPTGSKVRCNCSFYLRKFVVTLFLRVLRIHLFTKGKRSDTVLKVPQTDRVYVGQPVGVAELKTDVTKVRGMFGRPSKNVWCIFWPARFMLLFTELGGWDKNISMAGYDKGRPRKPKITWESCLTDEIRPLLKLQHTRSHHTQKWHPNFIVVISLWKLTDILFKTR